MNNRRGHVVDFDDSPLVYGSNLNSKNYNKIIDSLKTSVYRAMNRSRTVISQMSQWNKALTAESTLLRSKVRELQDAMLMGGTMINGKTSIVTAYDTPYTEITNGDLDKLSGQLTVGYDKDRKFSKVTRVTDANGDTVASPDITILLDGNQLSHDHDAYNILDNQKDTFWILETETDANHVLTMRFPNSIRPTINCVSITPFPAFGIKINKITILKTDGSTEELIPTTGDNLYPAMDGGTFHFKPTSWANQITIDFTARNNVVGFSNIDLYYIEYNNYNTSVTYKVPGFDSGSAVEITQIDRIDFGDSGFGLWNLSQTENYDPLKNILVTMTTSGAGSATIPYATLVGTSPVSLSKSVSEDLFINLQFTSYLGQSPVFRYVKVTGSKP